AARPVPAEPVAGTSEAPFNKAVNGNTVLVVRPCSRKKPVADSSAKVMLRFVVVRTFSQLASLRPTFFCKRNGAAPLTQLSPAAVPLLVTAVKVGATAEMLPNRP